MHGHLNVKSDFISLLLSWIFTFTSCRSSQLVECCYSICWFL